MARVTGLEPATSGVTGRHSNQLSYTRVCLGAAPICVPSRPVNRRFRHGRDLSARASPRPWSACRARTEHRRDRGFRSDRKSVVEGQRVSVSVDLGGRRHSKKKKDRTNILINKEK